jgi:hypothetical protein
MNEYLIHSLSKHFTGPANFSLFSIIWPLNLITEQPLGTPFDLHNCVDSASSKDQIMMKTYLQFIATVLFSLSVSVSAIAQDKKFPEYGLNPTEQETLSWAWGKAQKFSKITSTQGATGFQRIKFYSLTENELASEACPEDPKGCRGMAALYDTKLKRILIRTDLNPDSDMVSMSFLIHEMVHALQNETRSDAEMFDTCEKLYQTEKQAYETQDEFLKSEGQFFRAGNVLRFFICDNPEKGTQNEK